MVEFDQGFCRQMNECLRGRSGWQAGQQWHNYMLCKVGFPTQADATIRSPGRGLCGQVERSGTVATLPPGGTALRMVSGCGGMPTLHNLVMAHLASLPA